jgi:hypothetical protein
MSKHRRFFGSGNLLFVKIILISIPLGRQVGWIVNPRSIMLPSYHSFFRTLVTTSPNARWQHPFFCFRNRSSANGPFVFTFGRSSFEPWGDSFPSVTGKNLATGSLARLWFGLSLTKVVACISGCLWVHDETGSLYKAWNNGVGKCLMRGVN